MTYVPLPAEPSAPTPAPPPTKADVIIIGHNHAGYACAIALAEAGVNAVVVGEAQSDTIPPSFFIGGLVDNITRVHHAYGDGIAKDVWQFSQNAASWWATQLNTAKVPCQQRDKLRLHASTHEQAEGREAQQLLARLGLGSEISLEGTELLVHNENGQAYLCEPYQLSRVLPCPSYNTTVTSLDAEGDGYTVTLQTQAAPAHHQITATMAVITCEATLLHLRPFYRQVLIPYSDQWQDYALPEEGKVPEGVFYAQHGYVYGFRTGNTLRMAGGRFMEKGARVGDASGKPSAKVSEYLHRRGGELTGAALPPAKNSVGFWDSRSCDELPVIGPDFREPQLLVAGGFMSGGAACGGGAIAAYAGRQIAALISSGDSQLLPRPLWPTRLRSL